MTIRTADVLATVGRLASAGLSIGIDRVRGRLASFPTSADQVTSQWLEGVLRPRFPEIKVGSVQVVDAHSGTTSRARLTLEYEDPGKGPEPPPSVFIKLTPRALPQALFLAATGIGRNEVRFYRDLRNELPVRAPRCHAYASLPGERQFVLVLEDLVPSAGRLITLGDRASLADAAAVVDALAVLHGKFWTNSGPSSSLQKRFPWLPNPERRRNYDLPWERFVTGQMIELARRRFAAELGPGLESAAHLCAERRDLLEELWAEGPHTLIHGDCHLGNLFFEGDRAGFFDWQICARAPGMRDVSYFLCNSLPTALREEREGELIARYLSGLRELNVDAPDFESAWRQHRLFALYTFIAAAFTAAAGGELQSHEIARAGLRRATIACEALESVKCALESA